MSPDVTVVLPCFNEREHVELEIKRIRAALEGRGRARPGGSAPRRRAGGWWSGPTPT
jgi:hypothetical protein